MRWRGVSNRQRLINVSVQIVLWPLPLGLLFFGAVTDNRVFVFVGAGVFIVGGLLAVWAGERMSDPQPDIQIADQPGHGRVIESATDDPDIPHSRKSKPPPKP